MSERTAVYRLRKRTRRTVRDLLWKIGDRLCAHRLTFELGHQIGELGWRLRESR